MTGKLRSTFLIAGAAAAALFAGDSAQAQWGHAPATSYYHAPLDSSTYWLNSGYPTGSRYSLYRSYGHSSYYNPPYGAYAPPAGYGMPGYGVPSSGIGPYGGSVGNPRGRLKYDVYTPFGKQEVEYKFRRNGRIDVDYDD
ncbi:MAG: hypothetical protein H0T47_13205 [Planctomycetaceae bacterium]|nr:hypothetical protein [Planctomycetaceae bacterium]